MNKLIKRNVGIDLLRNIAIFMVVMLHILGQGGVLRSLNDLTFKCEFFWFIEISCLCAVNVFALISGYVGINSKHSLSSIISLWLQMIFYTIIIAVIYLFVNYFSVGEFDFKILIKSFFPVMSDQLWYFSAYFCLFFFMPLLNYIIRNMEKKDIIKILIISFLLFSVFQTIIPNEHWCINSGYSFIWLGYLYLIGAFINKYSPFARIPHKINLLLYLLCIIITFLSRLFLIILSNYFEIFENYINCFIVYTSPFILFSGIFLLNYFSKIEINNSIFKKIIYFITPTTFGIYIIHGNDIVYNKLLKGIFEQYTSNNALILICIVLIGAISIFSICMFIDYLRIQLFKLMRIKNLSKIIEEKIKKIFYKMNI